ncbi:unnamed protein product [Cuscuta campestris]|uniref:Uncharacterized protein n=1 Tax=Cuscuta campestris TaxID=132261 RepID=A0A484KMC5_9ASTE|nr:unnamed protein product [Cuscuta campestris]
MFLYCGRIKITDQDPKWEMEKMPMARLMGDMVILPNGEILIINGAASGYALWNMRGDPVKTPVLYQPDKPAGSRFLSQEPSTIPRSYPSTAILVRDGRVLVGGSNPHMYNTSRDDDGLPKELRLEAFSPSYLTDPSSASKRPSIVTPASQARFRYGDTFPVLFHAAGEVDHDQIAVTMVAPPFNTHSFSMNQRHMYLDHVISTPPAHLIPPKRGKGAVVAERSTAGILPLLCGSSECT